MIKRLFCFFLIFFFLISNSFAKENFILNWDKLIPLNAYDFVPETGITFEMWDDKNFVKKFNVKFLINDDVYLTKKLNADGCHLGQKDMNVLDARKIIGNKI